MKTGRKEAIAAYRERKVVAGIYAVRCAPAGKLWVGRAPDVATVWTRLRFTLRQGASPNRAMQAAWRAHGADAFTFEVIERFEKDEPPYVRDGRLKDRYAHWLEVLSADPV